MNQDAENALLSWMDQTTTDARQVVFLRDFRNALGSSFVLQDDAAFAAANVPAEAPAAPEAAPDVATPADAPEEVQQQF